MTDATMSQWLIFVFSLSLAAALSIENYKQCTRVCTAVSRCFLLCDLNGSERVETNRYSFPLGKFNKNLFGIHSERNDFISNDNAHGLKTLIEKVTSDADNDNIEFITFNDIISRTKRGKRGIWGGVVGKTSGGIGGGADAGGDYYLKGAGEGIGQGTSYGGAGIGGVIGLGLGQHGNGGGKGKGNFMGKENGGIGFGAGAGTGAKMGRSRNRWNPRKDMNRRPNNFEGNYYGRNPDGRNPDGRNPDRGGYDEESPNHHQGDYNEMKTYGDGVRSIYNMRHRNRPNYAKHPIMARPPPGQVRGGLDCYEDCEDEPQYTVTQDGREYHENGQHEGSEYHRDSQYNGGSQNRGGSQYHDGYDADELQGVKQYNNENSGYDADMGGGGGAGVGILGHAGYDGVGETQSSVAMGAGAGTGANGGTGIHFQGTGAGKGHMVTGASGHAKTGGGMGGTAQGAIALGAGKIPQGMASYFS